MIEIDPELFKMFGFWSSILALKVLAIAAMTVRQRIRKQVISCEEDTKFLETAKVIYDDPDVERVRRAHLNGLENVVPWFIITYLWLNTGPSLWLAKILIRMFVLFRVAHTVSYTILSQQPMRGITCATGYVITCYQALNTLLHYM